MAAWVQWHDSEMPVTAPALLRTGVGDEAGTMGLLGQAGREAKWAGRWCRFGLAGRPRPGKWLGWLRRGGGHEEAGLEGRARPAGLNGPKGRKYLGQISIGLWSNEI
jgi:hypothetical protein